MSNWLKSKRARLALVSIILAGITVGLGYFQFVVKPAMIASIISKAPPAVATVATVQASTEKWVTRIPAIGTFRAVAGIEVTPQVGGVIRAIHFESGQDVAKGAALIELDDSVEQADLSANLATLVNAELSLDRQRKLIVGFNTPRASLDAAQAARDTAAAAVEKSRALIAEKLLVAPFSGRTGLRKVDVGQFVQPGTVIVTLQQLDPIFVDFPVPEQRLADLELNQTVNVAVDAWPNQFYPGKIEAIDARVNADTRTVLVRASIENSDKKLRPGMFANVGVFIGSAKTVVTLPRTSVTASLYGDTVFVVKQTPVNASGGNSTAAGTELMVERRVVKTGESRDDRIVILSGVSAGETVVSEGQLKLAPNMPVRVDNSQALPAAPIPRVKE